MVLSSKRQVAVDWSDIYNALTEAAHDTRPVTGWTHNFYRYPARFAPAFAAAAVKCLSRPSQLILDPYMGGGTTVVEALAAKRSVIGNDLNSLATFITRVKVTPLTTAEVETIKIWATQMVPELTYLIPAEELVPFIDSAKTKNMSLLRARFIKKVVAAALASIAELPTTNMKDFTKCAVLRVAQWALDGRKGHTTLADFRQKLAATTLDMLEAIQLFARTARTTSHAVILNGNASEIDRASIFSDGKTKAALVVTSPPYPGVHVLYHRWQVDGRRETPAPYWIAGCEDGNGASFYNFADRRPCAADNYFSASLQTLSAIRRVIHDGGYMVQMLAFNEPGEQLPRYLANMEKAGFSEIRRDKPRIWRSVPNRKWHATLRGDTNSASEVVLVHEAVLAATMCCTYRISSGA